MQVEADARDDSIKERSAIADGTLFFLLRLRNEKHYIFSFISFLATGLAGAATISLKAVSHFSMTAFN